MRNIGIRNVGLWRRGVDANKFHPRYFDPNMRDLLTDGHPDDHLLLYVGRLATEKQVHQIRAALDQIPNTRLAIVGTGALEAELKQQFAGYPVRFMGNLSGELLARAFASSDVFVFPSAFESFGLVLLEAMASGTPVVSSRVGGAPNVITEGKSGYLFDVNDTEGMITGIRRVIESPAKLAQMRIAARTDAETHSWSAIMDELIECYSSVAEQSNRRALA
ncbi:MAG: glycosyltransferase [Anaerolineae bacterium]